MGASVGRQVSEDQGGLKSMREQRLRPGRRGTARRGPARRGIRVIVAPPRMTHIWIEAIQVHFECDSVVPI